MSDQFALDTAIHTTPQACVVDLTPPTFAGIAALAPQMNGSLLASWLAATDATAPISYEVFIQAATATGLFSSGNLAGISRGLSVKLYQDALGVSLQKGVNYFVGVRAVDGVGNQDSNLVSLSAVSLGVLDDDLAGLVLELGGIADAMAGSVSTEFVAQLVEDELHAVVDDDGELLAQLECEE
jgi:hypothetical protein